MHMSGNLSKKTLYQAKLDKIFPKRVFFHIYDTISFQEYKGTKPLQNKIIVSFCGRKLLV